MNPAAAAAFIAGFASRWSGIDPEKPKRGEREVLDRFGERVMLAWEFMADELRLLNAEKAASKKTDGEDQVA